MGKGKITSKINSFRSKAWKPRLLIQKEGYEEGDCPIAVLENKGFSPNKIINVESHENDILENTEYYHQTQELEKSDGYQMDYYPYLQVGSGLVDYLVTDVTADNLNGSPLFFSYELLFDTISSKDDIEIYKNGDIKVPKSDYVLQFSYDFIGDLSTPRYDSSITWAEQDLDNNTHRARILLPVEFASTTDFYIVKYTKIVNFATFVQSELIEIQDLYTQGTDYSITPDGLVLLTGTRIESDSTIFIIKDSRRRIKPLDILVTGDELSWQSAENTSWKLRLNVGSFIQSSGVFSTDQARFYRSYNRDFAIVYPVVKSKPKSIRGNIIKVRDVPIYVDELLYTYPDYVVEPYDETTLSLSPPSGRLGFNINGVTRSDIKVKSIDREKGFIQVNKDLNLADDIELLYYTDGSKHFILDNLELNPKISTGITENVDFNISGYRGGFGLALRPITESEITHYPYIYDLNNRDEPNALELLYPKAPADLSISGVTASWTDDDFFTFAEVGLNRLIPEDVAIHDARIIGGGMRKHYDPYPWLDSHNISRHEVEWHIDRAFYDGEPVPHGSLIVIHMPRSKINSLISQWFDSDSYEGDPYFKEQWVKKEVRTYIDKIIRKYISAGTEYILMDENFRFINLET